MKFRNIFKDYKILPIVICSVVVIISLGLYANVFYKGIFIDTTTTIYQLGRMFFYYFLVIFLLIISLIIILFKKSELVFRLIDELKEKVNTIEELSKDTINLLKVIIDNQLYNEDLAKKLHHNTQNILLTNFNELKQVDSEQKDCGDDG